MEDIETNLTRTFPELSNVLQSEPHPLIGVNLTYGTAGFRTSFELLDSTFLRMGMLAAIRSRYHNGAAVGLMVTASHNPEKDNGIKMVDYDGGMLAQSWEGYAYVRETNNSIIYYYIHLYIRLSINHHHHHNDA